MGNKQNSSVMFYRGGSWTLESRSHLSCEIWRNDTLAVLNCQDPVAASCIIYAKLMNRPFFCVNCASSQLLIVHLTIPAATNRWRNRVRTGRRPWGGSRYFLSRETRGWNYLDCKIQLFFYPYMNSISAQKDIWFVTNTFVFAVMKGMNWWPSGVSFTNFTFFSTAQFITSSNNYIMQFQTQ